jgi:hypothetical protein
MNKVIVPAIIVAAGMVATPAWSQAPQQAPGFQASRYFELPLEKDASRQVRMQNDCRIAASRTRLAMMRCARFGNSFCPVIRKSTE